MPPDSELEKFLKQNGLTDRDCKEIGFARLYAEDFRHGTDGHNRLLIIARLAELLEQRIPSESSGKFESMSQADIRAIAEKVAIQTVQEVLAAG